MRGALRSVAGATSLSNLTTVTVTEDRETITSAPKPPMLTKQSLKCANVGGGPLWPYVLYLIINTADFGLQPRQHPFWINAASAVLAYLISTVSVGNTRSPQETTLFPDGRIAFFAVTIFCLQLLETAWYGYLLRWAIPAFTPGLITIAYLVVPRFLDEDFKSRINLDQLREIKVSKGFSALSVLSTVSLLSISGVGSQSRSQDLRWSTGLFLLTTAMFALELFNESTNPQKCDVEILADKKGQEPERPILNEQSPIKATMITASLAAKPMLLGHLALAVLIDPTPPASTLEKFAVVPFLIQVISSTFSFLLLIYLVKISGAFGTSLFLAGSANIAGFLTHMYRPGATALFSTFLSLTFSSRSALIEQFPRYLKRGAFVICSVYNIYGFLFKPFIFDVDPVMVENLRGFHRVAEVPGLSNATEAILRHPIEMLRQSADAQVSHLMLNQSANLEILVAEYRRRYTIPPPPSFELWYQYVRNHNVLVYDDYDMIHEMMRPFWALEPATIRRYVQEAIGNDQNFLIALSIRNGRVTLIDGGLPWQREALQGMLESFVQYLPDLDLAFNAHDEPRVVVPHDQLSAMLAFANLAHSTLSSNKKLSSTFTPHHNDLSNGPQLQEYKDSRFNEYPQQSVAGPSRLSCPPDSPARPIDDGKAIDASAVYTTRDEMSFITNHTAYTDVCNTPSLKGTHAFFDRPNAFHISHDLVPIFSESKISSFQDVLYPSLWHWYGKVFTNNTRDMHLLNKPTYDEDLDLDWSDKKDSLYWRGSTTGGYARAGGWRKHHRQRIVRYLNSRDNATMLAPVKNHDPMNTSISVKWTPQTVHMQHLQPHLNVSFSGVGQCAEADCDAQKEFFKITPYANISEAYKHRYVLDMDGNAFSARFYGLMRSKSLVFKQSLFREWHDEWLIPWAHYIPLSLNTGKGSRGWERPEAAPKSLESEWAETLRYFIDADAKAEEQGEIGLGQAMAQRKRQWAQKVLRREDMQAWMFRLLLEYARVCDDRRDELGFTL